MGELDGRPIPAEMQIFAIAQMEVNVSSYQSSGNLWQKILNADSTGFVNEPRVHGVERESDSGRKAGGAVFQE